LERQLERDVAKTTSKAAAQQRILADDVEGHGDEERDLEITPMVALDLAYEDDPDDTDDIIDLGIQVGRMRITERIGGLSRPRLSEEVRTCTYIRAPNVLVGSRKSRLITLCSSSASPSTSPCGVTKASSDHLLLDTNWPVCCCANCPRLSGPETITWRGGHV
jgi:hypothetical protein